MSLVKFYINTRFTINMTKLPSSLNGITINQVLKLALTRQNFTEAIAQKRYNFESKLECYMLGTPDSHLSQQLDEFNGHRFGPYWLICDPT